MEGEREGGRGRGGGWAKIALRLSLFKDWRLEQVEDFFCSLGIPSPSGYLE